MKRAFIFGFLEFPHGSASANYVQNLALALKEIGYLPWVISSGNVDICQRCAEDNCYNYEGINFSPYIMYKNKVAHYLQFRFGLGRLVVKKLEEAQCSNQDIVIAYSINPMEMEPVFKFAKKKGVLSVACVPELFPHDYFPKGKKDSAWKTYERCINHSVMMADKQWVISSYIQSYYDNMGGDTLCFPALTDTQKYKTLYDKKVFDENTIKIVFTGNRTIKDSLKSMVKAIVDIQERTQKRIEFHITGVNREYFSDMPDVEKFLETNIILHEWMNYEELCELYAEMDFIFLARETNQVTLANFPSKIPEAMSFGVIPVVSKVGDYTKYYLKDNVNSIVFDGSSSKVCVEAMMRAVAMSVDDRKKMSTLARKCAENQFDYHVWAMTLKNHLENISDY